MHFCACPKKLPCCVPCHHLYMCACVRVCVRVYVRVCVCGCVRACAPAHAYISVSVWFTARLHTHSHRHSQIRQQVERQHATRNTQPHKRRAGIRGVSQQHEDEASKTPATVHPQASGGNGNLALNPRVLYTQHPTNDRRTQKEAVAAYDATLQV